MHVSVHAGMLTYPLLDEALSTELTRGFELNDNIPVWLRGSTSSLSSITKTPGQGLLVRLIFHSAAGGLTT